MTASVKYIGPLWAYLHYGFGIMPNGSKVKMMWPRSCFRKVVINSKKGEYSNE